MTHHRMDTAGRLARLPSGRWSKWLVVVFWLGVLVVALAPAQHLSDVQQNNIDAWLPSNAESTKALALQGSFTNLNALPAIVVYENDQGLSQDDVATIAAQTQQFTTFDHVTGDAVGPIPSQDGKAATVIVTVDPGDGGWSTIGTVVDQMRAVTADPGGGMTAYVTGPAGNAADQGKAFEGIDGKLLYTAGIVVIVILLFTYRSPILWMLPILSVVVALMAAMALIYLLAKYAGLTVNAQSQAILGVLVFGAGTDYALLLVARYREELRRHEDRHEAMAFALHRAGPAILASGSTVVMGMLVLMFASMNSTAGMGPVVAIGVAVGVAVMLTLLPALLVIAPRWVHWPVHPDFGAEDPGRSGLWSRVGTLIADRPRTVWVGTSAVLVIVSIGIVQLNATGLTNAESFIKQPDSVTGQNVLAAHFPGGSGSPVMVVGKASQADAIQTAVGATPGIVSASDPQVKGDLALVQGVLADKPDSPAAEQTVRDVRAAVRSIPGTYVGGATAIQMDVLDTSARDTQRLIPLILLVVLVILAGLLRALVAPVVLIATVVLSFFAALGLSALLFRHVLGFAGAGPELPLFAFVFLVALGIDYNIFLMTRVHEEARSLGTRRAALVGLSATGGVITSAGLVLAGTFSVLATLPVVNIAEVGLTVAIGVLLDTIIVRAVLVTALNLEIGRWMWWPSRLARRGPDAPAS